MSLCVYPCVEHFYEVVNYHFCQRSRQKWELNLFLFLLSLFFDLVFFLVGLPKRGLEVAARKKYLARILGIPVVGEAYALRIGPALKHSALSVTPTPSPPPKKKLTEKGTILLCAIQSHGLTKV